MSPLPCQSDLHENIFEIAIHCICCQSSAGFAPWTLDESAILYMGVHLDFLGTTPKGFKKRVDDGLSPQTESADNSSNGGSLHALQSAASTLIELIEFFLFKVALLVIFIAGLYRLVRREVARGD
jgi:hypothetical protein